MNVLILTPDAVGSTLLQRMLTIYMQFHEFDQPVINLHELTNGLARYYSAEFNRELVGKKPVAHWGYHQSLAEITDMLAAVDHYKTSRLAHYHIRRRGDDVREQIPFYNYLNENFYIIACERSNVFEHAVSMTLNTVTNKLNVYDPWEKIESFYHIYQSGVMLDTQVFVNQLDAYKAYRYWSQRYFNIGSYFNYERDIPRLEQYILELPVFLSQPRRVTWHSKFGIDLNTWNRCNYYRSDVSSLPHQPSLQTLLLTQAGADQPLPQIKTDLQNHGVTPWLNPQQQQQLAQHSHSLANVKSTIDRMIELGIIVNGPPIKKQTLREKSKIIKNFDQLIDIYNQWCSRNPDVGTPFSSENLQIQNQKEQQYWNPIRDSAVTLPELPPSQQ